MTWSATSCSTNYVWRRSGIISWFLAVQILLVTQNKISLQLRMLFVYSESSCAVMKNLYRLAWNSQTLKLHKVLVLEVLPKLVCDQIDCAVVHGESCKWICMYRSGKWYISLLHFHSLILMNWNVCFRQVPDTTKIFSVKDYITVMSHTCRTTYFKNQALVPALYPYAKKRLVARNMVPLQSAMKL